MNSEDAGYVPAPAEPVPVVEYLTPVPEPAPTPAPVKRPPPPPGPPLQESLSALAERKDNLGTLQIVERLQDPNNVPQTLADLFLDGDEGLDIYGTKYPMLPELLDASLEAEDFKGPLAALGTAQRQLAANLARLTRAEGQIKSRIERTAKAALRTVTGGYKMQRQHVQVLAVKGLRPFASGTADNRLIYSTKGTFLHLVTNPEPVLHDTRNAVAFATKANADPLTAAAAAGILKEAALVHFNNLLDHTTSLRMLGATERIKREVGVVAQLRHGTIEYSMQVLNDSGTYSFGPVNSEVRVPCSPDDVINGTDDVVVLHTVLDYRMQIRRNDIDNTVSDLDMLEELPVFRSLAAHSDLLEELEAAAYERAVAYAASLPPEPEPEPLLGFDQMLHEPAHVAELVEQQVEQVNPVPTPVPDVAMVLPAASSVNW